MKNKMLSFDGILFFWYTISGVFQKGTLDMYKIKESIIVEGLYDKIKLSRFIDGIIFQTNGFSIFSDKKMMQSIRVLAEKTGIVILTDSDSAGFRIRNYIKQAVPQELVKHAYVPDIRGKEKRKTHPGKEGLLGVEGMQEGVILEALRKAGCRIDGQDGTRKKSRVITKADLYMAGLSGDNKSSEYRRKLAVMLGIPSKISANMLLEVLNRLIDYDEYVELIQNIREK